MAVQAFVRGRVAPVHRAGAPANGGHRYRRIVPRGHVDKVGIALVRPPFVGEVVETAVAFLDGETGLHLPGHRGVVVVHGIVEVLDDHRTYGELPYAVLGELYPFPRCVMGTVVGYGHPAFLVRPVGPEGVDHVVGQEAVGHRKGPQVRKGVGITQLLRHPAQGEGCHEAVQGHVVALYQVEDVALGVLPEGDGPPGQGTDGLIAAVGDVHREYLPGEPIAGDVPPVEGRELRATVHLAAYDRARVGPGERRQRCLVGHAVVHADAALVEGPLDVALEYGPTVVLARGDHVDLLMGALTHFPDIELSRPGVLAHPVRATVAHGIVFFEPVPVGVGKRVVVGYPVELTGELVRVTRVLGHGAHRGMAPGRVHVHVDAQHAPVKVVRYVLGAYRLPLFPGGDVQEPVVAELHRPAAVGGVEHAPPDQGPFGTVHIGHRGRVHLETLQVQVVPMELVVETTEGARTSAADTGTGVARIGGIIDIDIVLAGGTERGMQLKAQKTAVPYLLAIVGIGYRIAHLLGKVHEQVLVTGALFVLYPKDLPVQLADHEPWTARGPPKRSRASRSEGWGRPPRRARHWIGTSGKLPFRKPPMGAVVVMPGPKNKGPKPIVNNSNTIPVV